MAVAIQLLTVDGIAETFRSVLLADADVVVRVPGGWLYDRQRQVTDETVSQTGYGVIRVDWVDNLNTSGAIFRHYTVTLAAYLLSNTQNQATFQQALESLLSFQPGVDLLMANLPAGVTSGIVMSTPQVVSQKVESEMRAGSDVTPVMCGWWIEVADARG